MAGKGSKPRPIIKEQYDKNFDNIIWKKSKNEVVKKSISKKGKTSYKY